MGFDRGPVDDPVDAGHQAYRPTMRILIALAALVGASFAAPPASANPACPRHTVRLQVGDELTGLCVKPRQLPADDGARSAARSARQVCGRHGVVILRWWSGPLWGWTCM